MGPRDRRTQEVECCAWPCSGLCSSTATAGSTEVRFSHWYFHLQGCVSKLLEEVRCALLYQLLSAAPQSPFLSVILCGTWAGEATTQKSLLLFNKMTFPGQYYDPSALSVLQVCHLANTLKCKCVDSSKCSHLSLEKKENTSLGPRHQCTVRAVNTRAWSKEPFPRSGDHWSTLSVQRGWKSFCALLQLCWLVLVIKASL